MKINDLAFVKGGYFAYVLTEACHRRIVKQFKPAYPRVYCHHVTLQFGIKNAEAFEELKAHYSDLAVVELIYLVDDAKLEVQCFTVTIDGHSKRPDGKLYHLTHSIGPLAKPKESNEVVAAFNAPSDMTKLRIALDGEFKMVLPES